MLSDMSLLQKGSTPMNPGLPSLAMHQFNRPYNKTNTVRYAFIAERINIYEPWVIKLAMYLFNRPYKNKVIKEK